MSHDFKDQRSGSPYTLCSVSTSVIEDALFRAVTHALGLSYTETGDSHSSFRSSTPGRLAAKSHQNSDGQIPRKYEREVKEDPVSSNLGTSTDAVGFHTLGFKHANAPGAPPKGLSQPTRSPFKAQADYVHPELGLINNEIVCNRDHKNVPQLRESSPVHSLWDYFVLSSACLVTSMPMRFDPRLTYRSSLHDIKALSYVVPYFDVSSVCLPRRRGNLSANAVP